MHLTITTLDDRLISIDVSPELEVENLKAQCEFELGIPSSTIVLTWEGRPLHDNQKTLKEYGIKDGDMLLLQQVQPSQSQFQPQPSGSGASGSSISQLDFSTIAIPGRPQPPRPDLEDPLVIMELLKYNPHERALLKERNPPLSSALESGNTDRFVEVYTKQRNERLKKEEEKNRLLALDPFSPETQRMIAEEIRLKNVESNMETAIEHVPESFAQVVMLYIDCRVNGHDVKAFVDSGAQMTIMSQACAERCNIMRLVDRRWAGIAKGVGTQKIIGRVHLGNIQIESDFLPSSFSILENQPMDMLLGLDMLKRHRCIIDLQTNVLVIGTTGTKTSFLHENQLPQYARINQNDDETDPDLQKALHSSGKEAAGSTSGGSAKRSNPVQQGTSKQSSSQSISGAAGAATSSSGSQFTSVPGGPPAPSLGEPASRFPAAVIEKLVAQGYNRQDVVAALNETNGDEQKALMILFARAMKFP